MLGPLGRQVCAEEPCDVLQILDNYHGVSNLPLRAGVQKDGQVLKLTCTSLSVLLQIWLCYGEGCAASVG